MDDKLNQALQLLPHGPEFRFLDRLLSLEPGRCGTAELRVAPETPFLRGHFPQQPLFGNRYISSHELGSIGITLLVLVALFLFFRFTPLGLARRAVAQNPLSSRLVGIRVGWMLALGWGLAAAVGAVAGMLVAPIVYLEPNMMSGVLLYAFAAALVGGIDNPFGAVVGGFMVGVLENLIGAYVIGTELKLTVALVLIVGVLLFKPSGMFGKVFVSRV